MFRVGFQGWFPGGDSGVSGRVAGVLSRVSGVLGRVPGVTSWILGVPGGVLGVLGGFYPSSSVSLPETLLYVNIQPSLIVSYFCKTCILKAIAK